MRLSVVRPTAAIPSYSLTGDLLAYLKCGLQYRYNNRGSLPPSKPVQLWFGEFIHAVMEEAYLRWVNGEASRSFPWGWQEVVRPIELEIARRLSVRGLYPPFRLFCPHDGRDGRCNCDTSDHKLIASQRAELAINIWGPHLFPLITEAEVLLQGIKPMPLEGERRSDYYEITGVVDVIGSVRLQGVVPENRIVEQINREERARDLLAQHHGNPFEVIVDYKGMRRPPVTDVFWHHFEWQVLTYAWLRSAQPAAEPVLAGVVLFLNELQPSQEDMEELQQDVRDGVTDVMPEQGDQRAIASWKPGEPVPLLSTQFRQQRSFRLVVVERAAVERSLHEFDEVVKDIEQSVLREMKGQGIMRSWQSRPSGIDYSAPQKRTCTVCDFKHYCPLAPRVGEGGPPLAP